MINNQNTFNRNLIGIIPLLGILFFAITISPFLAQSMPTLIYASIAYFLFLRLVFDKNLMGKPMMHLFAFLPFIVLNSFEYLLRGQYGIWARYLYQQLLTILPFLLIYYLFMFNKRKEIRSVIISIFFMYIATSITTTIGLVENPLASRLLAQSGDSIDSLRSYFNLKNIGGYQFIYSLVFVIPMTIGYFKLNKLPLFVFLPLLLITWVCVVKSQYGLAFMFMIVVSTIIFLPQRLIEFIKKRYFLSSIVLIVFVVMISPLIATFLNYIASIFDGKMYVLSSRIDFTADLLAGEGGIISRNSAGFRIDRLLASWRLFLQNPFGGTVLTGGAMGGHSQVLDMAAKYGIWGILALFFYYFKLYKVLYFPFRKTEYYIYMKISLALFIVFMCIDTVAGPLFTTSLFFMIPAMGYLLQSKTFKDLELESKY